MAPKVSLCVSFTLLCQKNWHADLDCLQTTVIRNASHINLVCRKKVPFDTHYVLDSTCSSCIIIVVVIIVIIIIIIIIIIIVVVVVVVVRAAAAAAVVVVVVTVVTSVVIVTERPPLYSLMCFCN